MYVLYHGNGEKIDNICQKSIKTVQEIQLDFWEKSYSIS